MNRITKSLSVERESVAVRSTAGISMTEDSVILKKFMLPVLVVLMILVIIPGAMTSSGSVFMLLDAVPIDASDASAGYSLTLHLSNALYDATHNVTAYDAAYTAYNATYNATTREDDVLIDNSLDGVDFSSIYELVVIQNDTLSYRYFGVLQFPISYEITMPGKYTFRLHRMSDGSTLSEVSFNYDIDGITCDTGSLENFTDTADLITSNTTSNTTSLDANSDDCSMDASLNTSINTSLNALLNVSLNASTNISVNLSRNASVAILEKCGNVFTNLSKDSYTLGEPVHILFSNIFGKNVDTELTISTRTSKYKFVGDLNDATFVPTESGDYTVNLVCDDMIVFNRKFVVADIASSYGDGIYNGSYNFSHNLSGNLGSVGVQGNIHDSSMPKNVTWKNIRIRDSKGETVSKIVAVRNVRNYTHADSSVKSLQASAPSSVSVAVSDASRIVQNDDLDAALNAASYTNYTINTSSNVSDAALDNASEIISDTMSDNASDNISDNISDTIIDGISGLDGMSDNLSDDVSDNVSDNLSDDVSDNASMYIAESVELELSGINNLENSSMTLNDVVFDAGSEMDIYIEDVPRTQIEFSGNIVASFAMDLSNLEFTNGTFTKTASGNELWKCADWDFTMQHCTGSWIKVMDITPGRVYDIMLSPMDPGYIETGVATINTLKSLYYPNETVDILMVVLDTQGYLVSGADVELSVVSPDAVTSTVSTGDFITSSSNGIYEVSFTKASLEGNYTMIVHAYGENVNSTMISQFTVQNHHPFDIFRDVPVTIDPNQGPFNSTITIVTSMSSDIMSMSEFDYTEVLPSSFNVTDLGGATESIAGSSKYLTWHNLTNNSVVYYSAQAPLETPNVYMVGQGYVSYVDASSNLTQYFLESRPWFLAIDPVFTGSFFMLWDGTSNAPPGWTCVSCSSGNPFYGRFIMGDSTYGSTGGNATHNHTIDYVSETRSSVNITAGEANDVFRSASTHTHSGIVDTTTSSSPNYPAFRQLKVIAYQGRVPKVIPQGAIGIFNSTSMPANWTLYTAENNYFIFANSTANVTGGSNNHTHEANITTLASNDNTWRRRTTSTQVYVAGAAHDHTGSGTVALGNNTPPYINVVLGKATSNTSIPYGQNFIGMFNDSVGDGWINMSQPGQPFYQKILRAASSYSAAGGGSNVSAHSNLAITTGPPDVTGQTRDVFTTQSFAATTHNHTIVVSFDNASIIPPYIDVVFRYANNSVLYPPIINRTDCYRQGSGWVNCTTLRFNQVLSAVRTDCDSDNGGTISNVSFILRNTDQDITYFNTTITSMTGSYWQYNLTSNLTIDASGAFSLTVTCRENPETIQDVNWTVPWGNFSIRLINPDTSVNVTQNRFFNFTINVSCIGGQCGDANISAYHNSRELGTGANGVLTVSSANTIVNTYAYLTQNVTSGDSIITVNGTTGLSAGNEILVIQMQNGTAGIAGAYEFATIASINGTNITLESGLDNSYYTGTFNATTATAAQIVRVPQYTNVTVNSGASIIAQSWNGYTGGIVIFKARGKVNVTGSITATGRGYRGGILDAPDTVQPSYQGESFTGGTGSDARSQSANDGGGGGGYSDTNAGAATRPGGAGGGSYGTYGRTATNTVGSTRNGVRGNTYGTANLSLLFLGSGGGSGGHTTTMAARSGGPGGSGGGIVYISADKVLVSGTISSDGGDGGAGAGNQWIGGGGGSGGSIFLRASNITAGTDLVTANGGVNGSNLGITQYYSGNGGNGRIRLDYDAVSGSTDPASAYNGTWPVSEEGYILISMLNSAEPFYTTTENPTLPSNNSCLSDMTYGDTCIATWLINATGKINSDWILITSAESTDFASSNYSTGVLKNFSRTVNVTIIGNIAPITRSIYITPVEPLFSDDLNCNFNITDQNIGDALSATVNWYRGDTLVKTDYADVVDGVLETVTLSSSYLTVGDIWSCRVTPYDQVVYGTESSSQNVTILQTVPPKINSIYCLRNNSIWMPCTSITYGQIIGKVRANCSVTDSYPVSVGFTLTNVEDSKTFFSGSTTDNSTGYWVFDNIDLLVTDSGIFNLSVNCTDFNGTTGYNRSQWLIPWGNLSVRLIRPNVSMNVTSKQFFNFTSSVTCVGGECGYINATLDPYREYFSSFEDSTENWTHYAMNGTASGSPATGLDQWHRSSESSEFGNYSWKDGSTSTANYSSPPAAVLVTPTYDIRTNIARASTVSFYHYLSSEVDSSNRAWDGGKMEYMLNSSGTWTKVPASMFITGGYNDNYQQNTAFIPSGWTNNEVFWAGTIGSPSDFSLVRINISSLSAENITFRFYFGGDDNNGDEGWYIDGFNITAWDYDIDKGIVSMNTSALPFYTTTQNPANFTTFSCLEDMHAGDTCNTTWRVNASDTEGTYTFFVIYEAANYSTSNISRNSTRINLTIVPNSAPVVSSITLSPEYAILGNNLYCIFTVTDTAPMDTLIANVFWYRNNILFSSTNVSVQHNVPYTSTLGAGNLSSGDTWKCGVRPYDQQSAGLQVNSTNKTVLVGLPPSINSIQCLRNDTTWINCTQLKFGDRLAGVRVNCTNVNATITNVSVNFSNTPDSRLFFNTTITTNSSSLWIYYRNVSIVDSGEFIVDAVCRNNNSVYDRDNLTWTVPWGKLLGYLVDPSANIVVEYNQFFTFTANISCSGGECGNITALLDPGFPLQSPTNGTPDAGSIDNPSGGDSSSGTYANTQTNDTAYYIAGKGGWGDSNSRIEVDYNVASLSIDAHKNLTSINLTATYCHSGENAIGTFASTGCEGDDPAEKSFLVPQNVLLYNEEADSWDSIGTLNTTNNENLVTSRYSINGTLNKYVNSTGFIRVRFEMIASEEGSSGQAWLGINYALLTLTYDYIKGGAPISTTIGALPFYTNNSNPYTFMNYSCLGNLSSLSSYCQVTWNVNATGRPNTTHEFWVVYNSTDYSSYVATNITKHIWITIENGSAVPPTVTLNSPLNAFTTNNSNISFNCSATDNRNLTSIALYGNFNGEFGENESIAVSGKNSTVVFNRILAQGSYTWNCMATDSDGNTRFANSNKTLVVDYSPPKINLSTPLDLDSLSSRTVQFNFTVTDNIDTSMICNLTVDSTVKDIGFSVANGSMISRTQYNLTTGSHTWSVSCIDNAGNRNTSETRSFTVLSVPPVVILQTVDNYMTNLSTVELYYFADDGGNIEKAELYINGVFNQTTYTVYKGESNLFVLTNVSEGAYTWTVNVTNDGGLSTQPSTRTFYVETSAPTLNVSYPPTGLQTNSSTMNFNFTTTDRFDSAMTCKITINGVDVATGINAPNNTLVSRPVTGIKNGLNYWNITCQNDAGLGNTSATRMLNVSAPPTVTLGNPSNNTFLKVVNMTFTYTPSASISVANCSLILNGRLNQTNTSVANNAVNSFRLNNLAEDIYNWSVNCTDNTGYSGSSVVRYFTIDTTAPYIILTKPIGGETVYGGTATFNFTAYDNIDPSLTCNLIINGSVNKSGIVAPSGQWVNVTVAVAETDYTWSVTCIDHALNSNDSITEDFTVIGAPTVTPVYPAPNAYLNYSMNINFTYIPSSSNTLVNATLYINGTPNVTINNPSDSVENYFFLNFTNNGVYTWFVRIFDNMGLNGSSTTRTFTIDTNAPVVGIITPAEGQEIAVNNVTFRFNATDNLAGSMLCNVTISGTVEWPDISVSSGSTITRNKVLNDGSYNWSVSCRDATGNRNSYVLTHFTVEAPPNVTLNFPSPNYRTRSQDITFNYTPRDDIGIANCTLVLNGANFMNSSSITRNVPNYFDVTGMAEGDYNWTVKCTDSAPDSNTNIAAVRNFTIDLTPPTLTLLYPDDYQTINNNTVRLNWTATDYPVNIACMLYIDDVYNRTVTQMSGTYFTPLLTNLTSGQHNWTVNCSDDLNNSVLGSTRHFTITDSDLYLDTSRISFNNTNPIENQTLNITANVSNIGGVPVSDVFVEFWDGEPGFSGVRIGNGTGSIGVGGTRSFSILWNITPGYHTIYVNVDPANAVVEMDETNNNASRNISILRSVIDSPANGTRFNTSEIPLYFTLYDYTKNYTGGALNYTIYFNSANMGEGSTVDETQVYVPMSISADGIYLIRVEARDALGRRKNSTAVTITVDLTNPSIAYASSNPANDSVQSGTSFTINVTHVEAHPDNVVLYWKEFSDSSYSTETRNYTGTAGSYSNFTLSGLDDGIYQYYVWLNDTFGRTNQTEQRNMRIDLYAPVINLMSPSDGGTVYSSAVELSFNVTDSSKYANCTLYIDGSANKTINNFLTNTEQYFAQSFSDGMYSWYINCSDQFGRSNVSVQRTFTVSNINPAWTGKWYESYDSDFVNTTALIRLADTRDAAENTATTTISGSGLAFMASAKSSLLGGHGILAPSGSVVNFSGVFRGRNGYATWKLYVVNETGSYLVTQSGNDLNTDTGNNHIDSGVAKRTKTGNSTLNKTWVFSPLDRFVLYVDVYNAFSSEDTFLHYWDDRSESWFMFNNMYVIGDANVSLVDPTVDTVVAPGYTFNMTCEVSCVYGTCINTYVYAQYNSTVPSSLNWTNITTNGNLKLALGQSNRIYLGNISANESRVNVTFMINTTSASSNNIRCAVKTDYNQEIGDETKIISVEDLIAPTVVLDYPPNYAFSNLSTNIFYFNVSENIALGSCSLYLNGAQAYSKSALELTNNARNNFTITSMSEGLYSWNVSCSDTSGNTGNSLARYLTVDYTAPVLTLITPADGNQSLLSSLNISFNVTDNIDTNLTCNVTLDGSVIRTNVEVGNSTTYSATVSGLYEGTHYWNVTCRDNATNTAISETRTFDVYTSPIIALISPQNNFWTNNSSVTFYFNVSDETGIENCSVVLYNGTYTLFTKTAAQITNNATNNITASGLNNTYNWSIECYDNTSIKMYAASGNRTLYVDRMSPVVSFVTANSTWFNSSNVTISFNATDNLDTVLNYTLYLDGLSNATGTTNSGQVKNVLLQSLSEGNHTILIEAFDDAGNLINSSALTIYIDRTYPRIRLNYPATDFVNDNKSTVSFSFTATDNLAAVLNCNLTISGGYTVYNITAQNNTAFVQSVSNISGGVHYWNVSCVDLAGNTNITSTRNFTIPKPDLTLNSTDIVFVPDVPVENQNITINTKIYNIGGNDASNFTVIVYSGNPSSGGYQLQNYTLALLAGENATISTNYTVHLGSNPVFVVVDYPLATNGSVNEENENNNFVNNTVYVSTWQYVLGITSDTLVMADNSSINIFEWYYSNATGSNIFVADTDNNINWNSLKAIGRNVSNQSSMADFSTIDRMLQSENYSDSVNNTYTSNGALVASDTFTVYGKILGQVPIANSTNISDFVTGILWDYSDTNPGRYNGSQDLVFITRMNKNVYGYNGTHDFELRVPAKLRSYKGTTDTVSLYIELR